MIDTKQIQHAMLDNDVTQAQLAKEMGIDVTTLRRKLKNGSFYSTEMDKMIEILNIENPVDVFFAQLVTQ